jgi:hypothetical protein
MLSFDHLDDADILAFAAVAAMVHGFDGEPRMRFA